MERQFRDSVEDDEVVCPTNNSLSRFLALYFFKIPIIEGYL